MSHKQESKRITIDSSATYCIKVQGYLEDIWSDRLADMKITMNIQAYQDPVTTLLGQIKDQSELIGVLNGLYELRMPLLSLELVPQENYT